MHFDSHYKGPSTTLATIVANNIHFLTASQQHKPPPAVKFPLPITTAVNQTPLPIVAVAPLLARALCTLAAIVCIQQSTLVSSKVPSAALRKLDRPSSPIVAISGAYFNCTSTGARTFLSAPCHCRSLTALQKHTSHLR